ncbi:MAG: DNA-processing protein DprA, partial [Gammaproteobacteria bacterium]|nr:DNA-processing protein DprA [Gammaproteobacteria bacterium]
QSNHIVSLGSSNYPELLSQIPDPPPILFIKGNLRALQLPQIAIVGSRNPTHQGRENAFRFAKHLSAKGYAITSGLAMGVDAASHEGCISAQGVTVSVVGTGLNQVYPRKNIPLAEKILESNGALVSELPPDAPIARENFPRRNRVISGLSLGTLVVEAAQGSGSLITTDFALEQGREVFAIPGSIHNPLAKGCHALIKQGAKLVESASDILDELAQNSATLVARTAPKQASSGERPLLTETELAVYSAVDFEPTGIDEVIVRSGLATETVSSILLVLELQGIIVSQMGGQYSRVVREEMHHERECF